MLPLLLIQLSSGAAAYVPAHTRAGTMRVLVSGSDGVEVLHSFAKNELVLLSGPGHVKVEP